MSDLTKKENTELTKPNSGRGLENKVDRSDLILPRAKKIEAMSPEMQDEDLTRNGIAPGKIINSITKEVLPEKFVPVYFFKTWIRFNANKEGDRGWISGFGPRDVIYMTNDKNDQRIQTDAKWEGDQPPLATTFLNFVSIFEGQTQPIVLSFGGTNYKCGKTLLSLATFKGGDLFSNRYRLSTKKRQNDLGSWFVFEVSYVEDATREEYRTAEKLYESFRGADVRVHESETKDEEVPY